MAPANFPALVINCYQTFVYIPIQHHKSELVVFVPCHLGRPWASIIFRGCKQIVTSLVLSRLLVRPKISPIVSQVYLANRIVFTKTMSPLSPLSEVVELSFRCHFVGARPYNTLGNNSPN